ncbi:MAG: helix-turn-helix domain-containing protein [Anaerolineaceae bacterium]|nr:helix-turn-helix domain-containing protein [Anaerolineaceae bacterium]
MDDKYSIQVLERAFSVMDTLLQSGEPLSLEAIMTRTGLTKSTAFRIISNLVRHGYLTETDSGYWLGLKMISFGQAVENNLDVRRIAAPYLQALRDQTNETAYLATLTHDWSVLYLDKCESRQPVGVMLHSPGMTIETYCTGLGKTLVAYQPEADVHQWLQNQDMPQRTPNTLTNPESFLAELAAIRQRGYGVDNGERSLSIRCIAVPIRNAQGKVIAALSVAGPTERMPDPLVGSEIAYRALESAEKISAAMGLPALKAHSIHKNGKEVKR